MTRRRLLGLPLGVIAIAIVIAFALSMTGTQPAPVDNNGNALSDEKLRDMRDIAETEGVSYQAAVNNYGWHNDFAHTVSDIRTDSPGHFTAGGISGDTAAWIAFKGKVPSVASEHVGIFLEKYPNVRIEFLTNVGFTEAESKAALTAAHYAVMNSTDVTGVGSSFDFETRRIDITANVGTDDPPAPLIPGLKQDAEAAVTEATHAGMLDLISVEIVGVNSATGGEYQDDKH